MRLLSIPLALIVMSTTAMAQTTAPANPLRKPPAASQAAPASQPAQASQPVQAAQPDTTAAPSAKPARRAREAASGDFKERRKRCSGEWRTAKAANNTNGQKWPQFFSACNTRLKAAGV